MNPVNEQAEHLDQVTITNVTITPVAFKDPPLLNTVGVHEPYALRAIVEVHTDSGVSGVGETYGDAGHLARLQAAAAALPGTDVFNINELRSRDAAALQHDQVRGGHGMSGMVTGSSTTDRVLSAFDVAALDIQGKLLGRPISDLLGGAVRDTVQFSGYLFYKWSGHPGQERRFAGVRRWIPPESFGRPGRWWTSTVSRPSSSKAAFSPRGGSCRRQGPSRRIPGNAAPD